MVKNFILFKISVLSFINHIFSKIVLPLSILPRENYKLVYQNNSPSDIIDSENRKSFYTVFQLGDPIQKVPLLINPTSNFYFINSIEYINYTSSEYFRYNFSKNFLSEYDFFSANKSNSSKLNYCRECEYFPYSECCSFNENILFYVDINGNNKKVNINFESMSNFKDNITGQIGLNLYDLKQRSYNTFLGILDNSGLIDNFDWYFDFNSIEDNAGKLIIGSLPHKDYPTLFFQKNLFFTNSLIVTGKELTTMKFTKSFSIDNYDNENIITEFNPIVELSYDSNVISSDIRYKDYLYEKMKDLFEEKICFTEIIRDFDYFRNNTFFYCKKEKNIKDKLTKIIKPIYFYSDDLNYTFEITPNEILKENGSNIFIQIIFVDFSSKWNLGKIFTSKYKFVFNQKNKQIGFYHTQNSYNVDNITIDNNNNKIILIISIILISCFILIFLGYNIGKYLNKTRKKRANELVDDFDYMQNNNNQNGNNKNDLLVEEDNYIN